MLAHNEDLSEKKLTDFKLLNVITMNLQDFKANELLELDSILGGTDIFGEDDGFIIEDDGNLTVSDFIGEETGGF